MFKKDQKRLFSSLLGDNSIPSLEAHLLRNLHRETLIAIVNKLLIFLMKSSYILRSHELLQTREKYYCLSVVYALYCVVHAKPCEACCNRLILYTTHHLILADLGVPSLALTYTITGKYLMY